jgi:3-hydroxyphenylacetate 6-hydroxylase
MIGTKLHIINSPLLQNVTPSSLLVLTIGFILISAVGYVVITEVYRSKIRLPRIPGPTGLPIVGNLYQLNPDPAETLHQWGKIYGGCYQIMLGTTPVVVFDSMQAARDVFIGQGHSLIDKPVFYTFHSVLSSVASSIGTTPWSDSTKRRRKTAATAMNRPAVNSYLPFINDLTKDLINALWKNGKGGDIAFDPRTNISKTITDLTLTVNYGARLPADDALLEEIIDVEDGLSRIKTPLGTLQDFIPILRYVPFNKKSETAKEINRRRLIFLNRFARELEERVEKGVDKSCIQGNCLRDPQVKLDQTDLMGISMSMVSLTQCSRLYCIGYELTLYSRSVAVWIRW